MNHVARWVGTLCGIGYSKYAPGTMATIVGALLIWVFPRMEWVNFLLVVSLLAGFYYSPILEREFKAKDPECVVIDEWAGLFVALFTIPLTYTTVILAVILFRFFDIVKPLGIRRLEKIPHPFSIMWDDLLAGLYVNIILQVVYRVI